MKMKADSKRTLHLEALENRVMLTADPLAFNMIQPAGTQAFYTVETADVESGKGVEFTLSTEGLTSISVLCVGENGGISSLAASGFQTSFQGSIQQDSIPVSGNTISLGITNNSASTEHYTVYVTSGSGIESELTGTVSNNTFRDTPQILRFSSIMTSSPEVSARKAVVFGEISSSDPADIYTITPSTGKINAQLYSLSGSGLTMELYDASQNLLAESSGVDGFTSVFSSVAVENATYFLRVLPPAGASSSGSGAYTLTVTENCAAETDTSSNNPLINVLDASGVGVGNVAGSETEISETSCSFPGETVRAMAVDGSHMAVVSYVKKGTEYISATVRLQESTGPGWKELASVTYTAAEAAAAGFTLKDFGNSVSISGTQILVGASESDAAFLLTPKDAASGMELNVTKLTAATVSDKDAFGSSVLISGNLAFVAAQNSSVNGTESGAVYVFKKGFSGWTLNTTLSGNYGSGISAAHFGSGLAWDAASQRLCVASSGVNTLNFFQYSASASAWTLHSVLDGTANPIEVGTKITEFGRTAAMNGNTLAVACKVNDAPRVRIYSWNSTSGTWNFVQNLAPTDAGATEFGTSLSFSGIQLAVSSTTVLNSSLENTGIVYLYRGTASENGMSWNLLQTFRHDEEGYFGKTVFLTSERLDVYDAYPLKEKIYSLSNFADVDVWKLNVTDVSAPVTFTLSTQKESEVLPAFEVTAPDGTSVKVTASTTPVGKTTYSFTPASAGVYTFLLYASDTAGASYVLSVASGNYASILDSGTVQTSADLSNTITVEYAQQILASSVTGAAATLGGKKLEFSEILDGNKVVWNIPGRVINGTYELAVSGLQAVTGDVIPMLNVSYEYSGAIFLEFLSAGPAGTLIQSGSTSGVFTAGGETLTFAVPKNGASLEDIKYAFTPSDPAMTLTVQNPVYDAENDCWLLDVSSSKAGSVTLCAALYAELNPDTLKFQTLVEADGALNAVREAAAVGTLKAGTEKTYSVTLAAGENMNFTLSDDAGNTLKFELYDATGTTLLAAGFTDGNSANGQRINGLKNTSATEKTYLLKITNSSVNSDAVPVVFTLDALSGAVLESEENGSLLTADVTEGVTLGTTTSKSTISLTTLDSSSLTTSQLESFGVNAVISGDYAAISGNTYVILYHLEGAVWTRMQTLDAAGIAYDVALDGTTLALGGSENVKIYTLKTETEGGSGTGSGNGVWTLSATLTPPDSIRNSASNLFGFSVALSDGTLAVSAPAANDAANLYNNCGYVFLYTQNVTDGTWNLTQEITSAAQSVLYHFGYEIALSGNTMAVYARTNTATGKGILTLWVRANGCWRESGLFETAYDSTYFMDLQLQVSDGRAIFCCPAAGTVYEYDWNGSAWQAGTTLETGITLSAVSLSSDGLRLTAAGTDSSGNSYLAEYLSAGTAWQLASKVQTSGTAAALACGNSQSLAVLRKASAASTNSGTNSDSGATETAGSVSLAQWAPTFDADAFCFIAASENVQISAVLTDGTDASNAVTLYDASGNTVTAGSALTAGAVYYITVSPTAANTVQRYILTVRTGSGSEIASGAAEISPAALCTPKNGTIQNSAQTSVILDFSENIDFTTLRAAALTASEVNSGKVRTASSLKILSGTRVEFTFNEAFTDGVWNVSLAENTFSGLSGTAFTLSTSEFTVDSVPAQVTDIHVDKIAGTITVTFSETLADADVLLTGENSGNVKFTEGTFNGNVLTLKYNTAALPADFYTFRVRKMQDLAGNSTVPASETELAAASRSFGITASEAGADSSSGTGKTGTGTSENPVTLADSAWNRAVTDGAFAYSASVSGFVTNSVPMKFALSLQNGEKIAFQYTAETASSGKFTAVWDAASGIVTVTTDSETGTAFQLGILRNASVEGASAAGGITPLELANIVTFPEISGVSGVSGGTGTSGNSEIAVRQTAVTGSISSQGETDTYKFTLSARSTVSAAVSSLSGSTFTLELYELLADGSTLFITSADGSTGTDTVDACISSAVNSARAEKTYVLKVVGTSGSGEYRLVVTENAVFNGISNGSAEKAVTLLDTNVAVGHVSQEASAVLASYARDAQNGGSVAAEGNFLYVGVPGDSSHGESSGKVFVYEFNGFSYVKISEIIASDTDAGDGFGTSMVLEGDTLVISAPSCENMNGTVGAVYLFTRGTDGIWTQSQKIQNPGKVNTDFGSVMDFSGGILVVGTQNVGGYTYAFKISENSYVYYDLTGILNNVNQESANWPYYGYSVATDGTYIIVGTPAAETIVLETRENPETLIKTQGTAFIFQASSEGISLRTCMVSENNDLRLGYSVAVENGLIAAAAVCGGEEGSKVSIYTTNLENVDSVTVISGITIQSYIYGRTLKLQNGVLTFAGNSAENTAYTYTLGTDGKWEQKDVFTSPNTSNAMFGFDSASAETALFVSDPAAVLAGGISTGTVYAFENQNDYYRMTASGNTISIRFADGEGLNHGKAAAGERIFAELYDADGNAVTDAVLADGVYTFHVTDGAQYFLQVSAAEGYACDYALRVEGITQTVREVALLNESVSTAAGTEGSILSGRPVTVSLTLSETVRKDRISTSSVQLHNGSELLSAESFTLSEDGKTVTFHFSGANIFYSSRLKIEVQTQDFCTISGAVLTDARVSEETGILELLREITAVSVTQKLKASETSTVLTWKFSEAAAEPAGGWGAAVTVTSTRSGVPTDVTSYGDFTYADGLLTWRAAEGHYAQTDDVLSTTLDASKLLTVSGAPLAELTQTEEGFFIEKSFTVNLNSSAETEIIIRKSSSIADVNPETGSAATLPENAAWIHEWNTIWVEIWGRVLSSTENGITTYSADVAYDAKLFTPFDSSGKLTVNWSSSAFETVSVTAGEGNTLRITATARAENVGVGGEEGILGGHALIASIRFTQAGSGGVTETFENGEVKPVSSGIHFVENSISVQDTSGITIEGNAEDLTDALPNVYPVVYDLDNNGSVTITDLIIFAKNYYRDTTLSDVTRSCDFDANGSVQISDLILFAKNFYVTGDRVLFSSALTENWGVKIAETPVSSASAAVLPAVTAAALPASAAALSSVTDTVYAETPKAAAFLPAFMPSDKPSGEISGQIGNVFWLNSTSAVRYEAPKSPDVKEIPAPVLDAAISSFGIFPEENTEADSCTKIGTDAETDSVLPEAGLSRGFDPLEDILKDVLKEKNS